MKPKSEFEPMRDVPMGPPPPPFEEASDRRLKTDIRVIGPEPSTLAERDPHGALWISDTQACCAVRKVEPFADALSQFDIWISGRKRYQGGRRAELPLFEADGPRLKVNPLAEWTGGDVEIYRQAFSLPQHSLVARGYRSIGCEPCTTPVRAGEDERAGRWRGREKTECGIHLPPAAPARLMSDAEMKDFG